MATAVRPLEITRFSKPTPITPLRFSILWLFQGKPELATPLGFLLPLVTNRTFGNKQNRLLHAICSSCDSTNSVKALKRTHNWTLSFLDTLTDS